MRGRKLSIHFLSSFIKKLYIKKESPNEGTETVTAPYKCHLFLRIIKKESPNEGTETVKLIFIHYQTLNDKKRIPE